VIELMSGITARLVSHDDGGSHRERG
jgi:hypothetical protein